MSFRVFDLYAERYDSWFEKNWVVAGNELMVLRQFCIERISLEVGVGSGFFASRLGVNFGVDASWSMLRIAKIRGVDVVQALGEMLPFRDKCFRTILIIVTLCFLEDPEKVLQECVRVLKENGKIIVCIIPRDSSWGKHYTELGRKGHVFYSRARLYTVTEVSKLLAKHNFIPTKALGTLTFKPNEEPRLEEPTQYTENKDLGFVCIEYTRQTLRKKTR